MTSTALTRLKESWCSRLDLLSPCTHTPAPVCHGSFQSCVRAHEPKSLQLQGGYQSGPERQRETNNNKESDDKAGVIINCIYTCLQINQCLHSKAPHKAVTRFPKSNYLYFQASKPNYSPVFATEKGLGAITLLLPSADYILNISTYAFVSFLVKVAKWCFTWGR